MASRNLRGTRNGTILCLKREDETFKKAEGSKIKRRGNCEGLPDGEEKEEDDGEKHLEVSNRREAEATHDEELQELDARELVDLALWHRPDVVVGRVGRLKHTPS